jgi:two-component system LytT family response regulator
MSIKTLIIEDEEKNLYTLQQLIAQLDALLGKLSAGTAQDKKMSIPTLHGYDFVDVRDIICCRSDGSYTTFYLASRVKIVSSHRIGIYEPQLCAHNFFRIHHSIIINMRFIKSYVKGKGGYVIMTDGTELEVSHRRRAEFLERLAI